jgi:hypothetical protein
MMLFGCNEGEDKGANCDDKWLDIVIHIDRNTLSPLFFPCTLWNIFYEGKKILVQIGLHSM